jgi:hypothetical protein
VKSLKIVACTLLSCILSRLQSLCIRFFIFFLTMTTITLEKHKVGEKRNQNKGLEIINLGMTNKIFVIF